MVSLRVVAIDDEDLALRRLQIALDQISNAELVGVARSGEEGLALIAAVRPDVVLLDIQMANLDGFELVERLCGDHVPLVIFVTAFPGFATRAFEVSAVDYILKPVAFERLGAALDKARTTLRLVDAERRASDLRTLVSALRAESSARGADDYLTEIWAERRGETVRVPVHLIDWMEADRDYVRLHARGAPLLTRGPLGDLQARLDPSQFVRVRRSALVRVEAIAAIRNRGYGNCRVLLTGGADVKVGKTYLRDIRRLTSLPDFAG
ncbi:MAG: LytTR family DNA-binding domain-containing protein [Pseudomonadota bacterium]|uniref:LytR/AlgR family response regulator transcription factor n=1 Tax=Phenylobacterium sp. TaxID=1871053 RepID=UPI0027279946|nr:LytTR family DNA-binding domain-containing protein [Phenylobacterium sp.]MDO9433753.1 LytTR family DNA-binding domain-containing protein [Phenylobacterium sp.]